jgi:hypothetical protein
MHAKTCELREQDKCMTLIKIKCMRTTTKYTWQYHKTNEYILSEVKINQCVKKKIQNYRNKCIQHVRQMDRQIDTLNYGI